MPITKEKLDDVMLECSRLLDRAREAKARLEKDKWAYWGCKETGAVRRASMDLTRALAELRKA